MVAYDSMSRAELIETIRSLEARLANAPSGVSNPPDDAAKIPVFGERERREFETSPWPIRIIDRETTKYLAVNAAALKLYGYTREEFLAFTLENTRHPEDPFDFYTTLAEPTGYLRHRGPRKHINKSGQIIVVEVVTQDILFNGRAARLSLTLDMTERVCMETLLRKREQEFSALVENAPDIIARLDRDLRYVYVNPAVSVAMGIPRGAFIGKTSREVGLPESLVAVWDKEIRAVFHSGEECRVEFASPCGNEIRHFEARMVPERGPDGAVETVLAIVRDITARREAELMLKVERDFIQGVIDAVPSLVFVKDSEGRFVLVNEAMAASFGMAKEQMINRRNAEIHPNPKESAGYLKMDREVIETRVPSAGEETFTTPEGSVLWFYTIKAPLLRPDGRVDVVGIATEITERKQAEKELKRQRKLLEAIIDNLPVGVFIREPLTGRYIMRNRFSRERFGRPSSDSAGLTVYDLYPSDLAAEMLETDKRAFETGQMVEIPAQAVIGPSGEMRIQHRRKVPLFDEHGRPWVIVGIADDITERKRAEDDMKRSQERLQLALEGARLALWDANAESGEVFLSERWAEMLSEPQRETRTTVKDLLQLVHPEDRQRVLDAAVLVLKGVRPDYAEEHRVRTVTGEWRWMLSRGRVTERAANGRAVRMSGTNLDITERKRAEYELGRQKKLLDTIIENIPIGVSLKEADTLRFVARNPASARLTGVGSGESVGKTVHDLFPKEVADAITDADRAMLRTGAMHEVPERVLAYSPEYADRTLRVRKVPVRGAHGAITHILTVLEDVTEYNRIEAELRRSEQRLNQLISMSPATIFSFSLDPPPGTTFISENVTAQVGWQPSDFTENPSFWIEHVHPDDRAHAEESVLKIATDGKYQCEYRFRHKDGSWRWMHDEAQVVRAADGRPCEGIGIWMDVTERKRAEEGLRASEARFRQLAENIQQVFWINTLAGDNLIYVSPAYEEIWGRSREALYRDPRSWMKSIHPEDLPVVQHRADKQMRGECHDVEYRIIRPDGSVRWINDRSYHMKSGDGTLLACGIAEDITARRLAEEQRLSHARQQRDALVREVHHRIKNSLQGVVGLLGQFAGKHPDVRPLMDQTVAQLQAVGVVHGLLGRAMRRGVLLREIVPAIAAAIEETTHVPVRVEIAADVNAPLLLLESEAVPIALVLNEVMLNAAKCAAAQPEPDAVRVTLSVAAETARVAVSNPGRLPAGFNFARDRGIGTGLELVRSLLPQKGMTLAYSQASGRVETVMELCGPAITPQVEAQAAAAS